MQDYAIGLFGFVGGEGPVQGWGLIAGRQFYFRARYEHWSMAIAGNPYSIPVDHEGDSESGDAYWEQKWGKRKYDASYMPQETAEQLVRQCRKEYIESRKLSPPWMKGIWGTIFMWKDGVHPDDLKALRRINPKHKMFCCVGENEEYLEIAHCDRSFRIQWERFTPTQPPVWDYGSSVWVGEQKEAGRIVDIAWHMPGQKHLYTVDVDGEKR